MYPYRASDLELCKGSLLLEGILARGWAVYVRQRQREMETWFLSVILKKCKGDVSKAARIMGINRPNIYRLIRRRL